MPCAVNGTFLADLRGCGAAVLAAVLPNIGICFLGVTFAFGPTLLTVAYAVGHIDHFNPAVTIGLWAGGCCESRHVVPFMMFMEASLLMQKRTRVR